MLSTKTAVITEKAGIVAAAIPRYADVTGQGIEAPRDIEGDQFSATSVPGVKIGHRDAQGVAQKCTLGPAVTNGTRTGFLIAGHCDGDQYAQVNFDGRNPLSLGPAVQAQDGNGFHLVTFTFSKLPSHRIRSRSNTTTRRPLRYPTNSPLASEYSIVRRLNDVRAATFEMLYPRPGPGSVKP